MDSDYHVSENTDDTFIMMYSGIKFYPFNPKPEDVLLDDICYHLSRICRFNGGMSRMYSVAEHSIRVAQILPKEYKIYGLLHDAAEVYFSDIPRPIKVGLRNKFGDFFDEFESNIMDAVYSHFNIPPPNDDILKELSIADNTIGYYENKYLRPNCCTMKYSGSIKGIPMTFQRFNHELSPESIKCNLMSQITEQLAEIDNG
jgi:hypothetical protein